MDLPRFILLKSNNNKKYLRYRKEEDSSHAFLQFLQEKKDEKVGFQYVKFEVEKAKTEGFVHIRSCYNNKYWVRKSADNNSIVAEANEQEEDQSKISCTLFKPFLVEEDNNSVATKADDDSDVPLGEPRKIRLMHIDQLGQHLACVSNTTGDHASDLLIGDQDTVPDAQSTVEDSDVFTVYNATSYMIIPDHVALMAYNDEYCVITNINGTNYLEFKTTDIGAYGTLHQVLQNPLQQFTTFLSLTGHKNLLWIVNSPYIIASPNFVEFFRPIRVGGNEIALRSQSTNRLANCITGLGMLNALGVTATSITAVARFRVAEAVHLREVSNVTFNLNDSRVYGVSSVEKYHDSRGNNSSLPQTGSFRVSYTVTNTMTWSDSLTVSSGLTASWTSGIPFVGLSLGVEISSEQTESREMGTEIKEEHVVEYEQTLTIPPRKRVILTVLATKASCDVPFTCSVRDVLTDGTIYLNNNKDDGLFKGSNEFNFITKMIEVDV